MTDFDSTTPMIPARPSVAPGWYPDPASGRLRYWDGAIWTENFHNPGPAAPAAVSNSAATASLVLGIVGFVLMAIPFFIGWFLGGIPDILAVIFGIVALTSLSKFNGAGKAKAIVGLVLGSVSLLSVFVGAGSIW
ncbi:hypothetical protein BH10ACT4_BH10ACT4_10730 [soil metagenome]